MFPNVEFANRVTRQLTISYLCRRNWPDKNKKEGMTLLAELCNGSCAGNMYILLFHYYVFLPYKVKRRRKIRGRNTLLCPSLTGLQQGEYFSNGFRVVYVIRTDKIMMFWILLPENRSQNNIFSLQ